MSEPVTYEALKSALLELLDENVDADELMFVTGLDRQTCEGILQLCKILALRDQLMNQTGGDQ